VGTKSGDFAQRVTLISQDCWVGNDKDKLNDQKGYSVNFNYYSAESFLKLEMKDSIKSMGYEIYDKPIFSNKIPLILDK
jgi:hypothetical protein